MAALKAPAACRAVPQRRSNAAKERLGRFRQTRMEVAVGLQHRRAGLVPWVQAVGSGEGRITIILEQLVKPQQAPLQRVVPGDNIIA